ncbi:MAG: type II toxin-antitoxin system HicB family antitoxin [Kiritimatiellae bacterium]|nr:type II toxin-antitoxin system HicB family antitoxin [Kiritimatiellia bacterium]
MKFKVEYVVHKEPGPHKSGDYVYSIEFPYLPGCATDARTLAEAHANAREVAEAYIESQLEDHPDVPLYRYDPWDWMEDPGRRFEMVVEVPGESRRRRRNHRRRARLPVCP